MDARKASRLTGVLCCFTEARHGVYAMEAACTHADGPLQDGEVKDGVVTCPWHGSRFRATDGTCLFGPATFPQLRIDSRIRDSAVQIRGRQG
jgi:nitrite reductase/ring-hydroxylating ferredoxin subunit